MASISILLEARTRRVSRLAVKNKSPKLATFALDGEVTWLVGTKAVKT
jgi:hypothetical protein